MQGSSVYSLVFSLLFLYYGKRLYDRVRAKQQRTQRSAQPGYTHTTHADTRASSGRQATAHKILAVIIAMVFCFVIRITINIIRVVSLLSLLFVFVCLLFVYSFVD